MTIKDRVFRLLDENPFLTPLQLQQLVRREEARLIVTLAHVAGAKRAYNKMNSFRKDDGEGHDHE